MSRVPLQRLAVVAILVTSVATAACIEEDDPEPSTPPCGRMRDVVERFGAQIRGPYVDRSLDEFRFVFVPTTREQQVFGGDDERLAVVPPAGSACELDLARRLEAACGVCGGVDTLDVPADLLTLENCLLEVESVFWTPSQACALCGDGRCTGEETRDSCAEDCRCGDGLCEIARGELPTTCPVDCPVSCGNGVCERLGGEACACDPGDGECVVCQRDCCVAVCGDGVCDPQKGESLETCEQDCASGSCGDGFCLGREAEDSCPEDCRLISCLSEQGEFAPTGPHVPVCGDGTCMGCEPWTCNLDCAQLDMGQCRLDAQGQRVCPDPHCGDGTCLGAEDAIICPQDCSFTGEFTCQNSVCELSDMMIRPGEEDFDEAVRTCPDLAVCDRQFCGDGYCQVRERPGDGGIPLEGTDLRVCAQDCGNAPCNYLDRELLCPPGAPTLRCDFIDVPPLESGLGHSRASVIIDCSQPCPVTIACANRCAEVDGQPQCVQCPSNPGQPMTTSWRPCSPGDPDICDDPLVGVYRCAPPTQDAADRLECYSYRLQLACNEGCQDAECLP